MIKGKAFIEIEDEDRGLEIIYKALFPEVKSSPSDKSKVNMMLSGKKRKKLRISINSKDASSFKASISSYIRWMRLSYKIKEGLK